MAITIYPSRLEQGRGEISGARWEDFGLSVGDFIMEGYRFDGCPAILLPWFSFALGQGGDQWRLFR